MAKKKSKPDINAEINVNGMPTSKVLDSAKEVLNERIKASKKIVNSKKDKWNTWEKMYKNEQLQQRRVGESNLIIPKADYIIEVISSKIINTIFGVADWLTLKHPGMGIDEIRERQKWLMYVMDRKVKFYMTAIELFKSAPIKGTSMCKPYHRNFWPYVEYMKIEDFLPDPLCKKPGDVQEMRYCAQLMRRDLNQLKNFIRPITKKPVYFNLDILEAKADEQKQKEIKAEGTNVSVEDKTVPIYDLVEYHGEFEYKKGKWGEFTMAASMSDKKDDEVEDIIRCEESKFKYKDKYQLDEIVFFKPFVASIYGVNPGEFYGKSAISSVESLISEQTEHHNLYMETHKRMINQITKVLNRSQLGRDQLPFTANAIWYLDSFDDVDVEQFPEVNFAAFKVIHDLYDRETEKTSGVTAHRLGVGKTKRETLGEVREMLAESGERFQIFIQMADRVTLRNVAQYVYVLLQNTINLFDKKTLPFMGGKFKVNRADFAEDMDISFTATTIESEYSKYAKQQTFPDMIKMMAEVARDRLNVDEVIKETGAIFNYNEPERFLLPAEPMIPIGMLPEELQPIAIQILQQVQMAQGGQGGQEG